MADIVPICLEFADVGFAAVTQEEGITIFASGTASPGGGPKVRFQPDAGALLDEALATKLPVDPLSPPTALE